MKPYMDGEWLASAYSQRGPSLLAKELGVSDKTINYWVRKLGIPHIGVANNNRRHQVDENFFEYIDTEIKAYWLGFVMADGCVYPGSSPGSFRFQMNLATHDAAHLELFNSTIKSSYPIVRKMVGDGTGQTHYVVQLKINNTIFCYHLMRHGVCPRKSGRELIPKLEDKHLLRHFIRGYFDGDGHVSITRRGRVQVEIVSASSKLISQLQEVFTEHGIAITGLRCCRGLYRLYITNRKLALAFADYLYADATVYLQRKKEVFDSLLT